MKMDKVIIAVTMGFQSSAPAATADRQETTCCRPVRSVMSSEKRRDQCPVPLGLEAL